MGKESSEVRRRKASEKDGGGDGDGGSNSGGKKDDGLIYKNGKAYKPRKDTPDIWTMLSQGAPPEPGDENKPKKPKRWYDDLIWPAMLFLTFCLSLFLFHIAPHNKSEGRRRNRFTMDNIASGGFANGGYDRPQEVWGMPGSGSNQKENDDDKEE